MLLCTREPGNHHDSFTVAVKIGDIVIGYLPHNYLGFAQSLYNEEDG